MKPGIDSIAGTPFNPPGDQPCTCMQVGCNECRGYQQAQPAPGDYPGSGPLSGPHRWITDREKMEQDAAMNGGLGIAEAHAILRSLPKRPQKGGVKKSYGKRGASGKKLKKRIESIAKKLESLIADYERLPD